MGKGTLMLLPCLSFFHYTCCIFHKLQSSSWNFNVVCRRHATPRDMTWIVWRLLYYNYFSAESFLVWESLELYIKDTFGYMIFSRPSLEKCFKHIITSNFFITKKKSCNIHLVSFCKNHFRHLLIDLLIN